MFEIEFLGTSSMVPTKKRNHSAILLKYNGHGILMDCGEGTQRQLRIAGYSPAKIDMILISHWHGDHVLGLPGLFQSMAANNYNGTLKIFGPKGTKKFIKKMFDWFLTETVVEYEVKEIEDGVFYEDKDFYLESKPLNHSVPCVGYAFIEKDKRVINLEYTKKFGLVKDPILKKLQAGKDIKYKGKLLEVDKATKLKKGKKVTFISDTAYCDDAVELAKNSDLLISESTWDESFEKLARERKHLTSVIAAKIAKESGSKKLVLTHFSQRYKSVTKMCKEAKTVFKDTSCAEDFLILKL